MSLFKKLAVAVVISSAFLSQAQAVLPSVVPTAYDFGALTGSKAFSNIPISGQFDDLFNFSLNSAPGISGSLVGIDAVGDFTSLQFRGGVVGGTVSNWIDVPLVQDRDGVFSLNASQFGLIPGIQYFFELRGSASGAAYSVTLAPVPEPETWALLLAGLGVIGGVARRRSANLVSAS